MPRHDVAVYAPYASVLYEAEQTQPAGGAEFQTGMLATGSSRLGCAWLTWSSKSPPRGLPRKVP